jgi:hypothetical protein
MAEGISLYKHIDVFDEYDIFRKSPPTEHDVYVKGIPYVFITTPKLNFELANTVRDNFMQHIASEHPDIMKSLNGNGQSISPFIRLLTNTFRGMDGKDLAARTIDVAETFYGHKQTLPISIVDSQQGDTMTIKFEDFKNLPVVKLHKLWLEYTEKVRRGIFRPNEDAIKKRYLDFVSSIYYFVLDFDGETILYYSKYTGAYPISVPYSNLVTDGFEHDIPELSVEYAYSFKEDMEPAILMDFNKVSMLDNNSLMYQTGIPNAGYIPYRGVNKDLFPYDFTQTQSSFKMPIIVRFDSREKNSLNPSYRYALRFGNTKQR